MLIFLIALYYIHIDFSEPSSSLKFNAVFIWQKTVLGTGVGRKGVNPLSTVVIPLVV